MQEVSTLIIGASFAGLATAAALQRQGLPFALIEKTGRVGAPWRRHYERLHLHTPREISHLPFLPFPPQVPRYASRQQVVDYLEAYAAHFTLQPQFNTEAFTIQYRGGRWLTTTSQGGIASRFLVMATGAFARPRPMAFPGLPAFEGPVLHSSAYQNGKPFAGQSVLVIGFGNSACEIAIDLVEAGARPALAVRSPVNIVPRDILGVPVLSLSRALSGLPPRVADTLSAPLIELLIGDVKDLGLRPMPYGPLEQLQRDGKSPVLDIGAVRLIRRGLIRVFDDIEQVTAHTVQFKGGMEAAFDAIIAATGYTPGFEGLLETDPARFEDLRLPAPRQAHFGEDGLYFCGYWISPTGQIREIGSDAQLIAQHIAKQAAGA